MRKSAPFLVAVFAVLITLLVVSGCSQQQQPQTPPETPEPTPEAAPATATPLPEQQQAPPVQPQMPAAPVLTDLFEDNLDEALDELGQLE
ncbi:hypothetical protein HYU16_00050 [Candidatus Woesearchaeota archaeon]|nr:hypothetical protein [Candidatus Woesearchaeota archaeon]